MVLKNKDGTVYKISGPNPLMMEQDFWDGFEKHNFEWTTEKTELEEIEIIKREVKLKEIKVEKPIKEIKTEQPKESIPKTEQPKELTPKEYQPKDASSKSREQPKDTPPKKEESQSNKKISDYKTIQSYCLPANSVERTDELYGEKYIKTEYLDAFTFESVIIEKEDFYIKFWTNIDYNITKNSIIYPRNKEKRWWKVSTTESAPQGKIYIAYVSDYTPSFE